MANLSSSHCFVPLQFGQEGNLGCSSTRSILSPGSNTSHHRKKGRRTCHPSSVTSPSPCDLLGKLGSQELFGEDAVGAHSSSQGFLEGKGGISLAKICQQSKQTSLSLLIGFSCKPQSLLSLSLT